MLLGISVIDSLQSDLMRVTGKAEKQQTNSSEVQMIDKLREERDNATEKFSAAAAELTELQSKKEKTEQLLETKRQDYSAKGGDIYAQRQQFFPSEIMCQICKFGNDGPN